MHQPNPANMLIQLQPLEQYLMGYCSSRNYWMPLRAQMRRFCARRRRSVIKLIQQSWISITHCNFYRNLWVPHTYDRSVLQQVSMFSTMSLGSMMILSFYGEFPSERVSWQRSGATFRLEKTHVNKGILIDFMGVRSVSFKYAQSL